MPFRRIGYSLMYGRPVSFWRLLWLEKFFPSLLVIGSTWYVRRVHR
jgi:hypothetical protein